MGTSAVNGAGDNGRSVTGDRQPPGPRLVLLPSFELSCDGRVVALPVAGQRVLAFLATSGGRVLRSHVAGSLWPDTTEERAQASLRTALWRCRQADTALVESAGAYLRLAAGLRVDYLELLERIAQIPDAATELHASALDLAALRLDLLVDWYDEFAVQERERFRQVRLHALEALCERLTATGRFASAIEAGIAAVACEPLRESAQCVLIKAYLAEGNRCEAFRQYQSCRALLLDSLGLGPSPLLEDLMAPTFAGG